MPRIEAFASSASATMVCWRLANSLALRTALLPWISTMTIATTSSTPMADVMASLVPMRKLAILDIGFLLGAWPPPTHPAGRDWLFDAWIHFLLSGLPPGECRVVGRY